MRERIEYLDSLRGLAAFAVLCCHIIGAYGEPPKTGSMFMFFPFCMSRDGFAAVSLFFVLSGLVLSLKYFRRMNPGFLLSSELGPYYVRRIARIYLPFVAVLALSALAKTHFRTVYHTIPPAQEWIQSFWRTPLNASGLGRQLALVFPTTSEVFHLIPQDWTLTIELNISFWVPFLILIAVQDSAALLVFSVVSIALLRVHGFVLHFAAGILIAKYCFPLQTWVKARSAAFKGMMLLVGLYLYAYRFARLQLPAFARTPVKESWVWYVTGLGATLIIISAMGSWRIQRILHARPLIFLGRISYSVYLIHTAVLLCFTPYFLEQCNRLGLSGYTSGYIAGGLATIFVTLGLSELSYRWIELPSIGLGRQLVAAIWNGSSAMRSIDPHAAEPAGAARDRVRPA